MRLSAGGAEAIATNESEPALMMAAARQSDDVRRWYEWAAATERWYAVATWNDAVARNEVEAAQRASAPPQRPLRPRATTPPSTLRRGSSSSSWDGVAACESGGNWSTNTGNGFEGGLQFTHSTWVAYGGLDFAQHAYQASSAEQIAVAERVASARGSRADWPVCGSR